MSVADWLLQQKGRLENALHAVETAAKRYVRSHSYEDWRAYDDAQRDVEKLDEETCALRAAKTQGDLAVAGWLREFHRFAKQCLRDYRALHKRVRTHIFRGDQEVLLDESGREIILWGPVGPDEVWCGPDLSWAARIPDLLSPLEQVTAACALEAAAKCREEADRLRGKADQLAPVTHDEKAARHSPDFRSVHWFGTDYTFAGNQAACVRILWEAWENGTPDVGADYLIEAADIQNNTQRIDTVFRNNSAWDRMIVPGKRKGSYRLQEPRAKPAGKKSTARAKRRT